MITDALKIPQGNISGAAKISGITERIMGLRVNKYEIDSKRFRT
jgi:Nif-specific regulatory protein